VIRHIVFFTVKDGADKETVFQGLSLLTGIPHKRYLEVGRNLLTDIISPGCPDFVVYGEFADEEQLAAYKAHPLYQQSISIVRPLRDLRMAADFLSE
jgi:hypothetical protein